MKELSKKNKLLDPEYMGTLISKYTRAFLDYNAGDVIKGKVMQITNDEVFIDVGEGVEGLIPIEELSLKAVATPYEVLKENDEIESIILEVQSESGRLVLSKKLMDEKKTWEKLKIIFENKEDVEVSITRPVRGGLMGECFNIEGFIPASQVMDENKSNEEIKSFLHQVLKCKIAEFDAENKRLVFSQKIISADKEKEKSKEIKVGDIKKGTVIGIASYGVFVDLQGAKGLIHISELSWGKVNNPNEIVKEGEEIEVMVLKIEKEHDRISLSLKRLKENLWEKAIEQMPIGSIVKGTIEKIIRAGALVKFKNNLVGLIPYSEIEEEKREQNKEIKVGDELEVKITNIIAVEQKMFLSIKQAKEEKAMQVYKEQAEKQSKVELGEIFSDILKKDNL